MIIPESIIKQLLSDIDFQSYIKKIGKDYSKFNRNVKFCSFPNCFYFAEAENIYLEEI